MLKVQEWLIANNGDFAKLEDQLGIKAKFHDDPADGRVILNYNQIDSPKTNLIVRECRGLTLNRHTYDLVARSFRRFFNWGEVREEMDAFVWEGSEALEKEDGSLLIVYYYNEEWHISTKGSFGDGFINDSPMTWRQLAKEAIPDSFWTRARSCYTYVFELCSLYNKIVRSYAKPEAYLLSMFYQNYEMLPDEIESSARWLGVKSPVRHRFTSGEDVEAFLRERNENDPTFEGIVIRDGYNTRFKFKSDKYVALHRLSNNGNILSYKNLVPLVLKGEIDEIITYFPEVEKSLREVQSRVDRLREEVYNLWYVHGDEKNQKKFAMYVKDHPLSSVLFEARKLDKDPVEIFNSKPERIIKYLEK